MERGLISVDRWAEGSQAYFLTHLHADHTRGLTSAWSRGPLFCSRLSAKLLPSKFPGFDLSLLRVLDVGAWHSLSLLSPSSAADTLVRVMPLDAHHCPGAVMYLFSGHFGSLLYTGDFRWETTSEKANRSRDMLVKALNGSRVNALYLDNTYCNPSYSFPSRRDAAQQVVDIIASHPKHHVIIGIDTLGKEDLLVHIARVLKIKRVQHKGKESGKEHVRVVRAEASVEVNDLIDSTRKGRKCGTVGVSGVYMSRASASRRRRRGAKIMEDISAD
ncbi:uncharacterized protein LOC130134512 isoform X2 [Syzygium oleosum]|uniref:uncharacterized protein LOC130134512 isoform X2 n=1 Tax=Syzygium oleosum TaxID=219896 RepID=UPI0024B8CF95|nr:uncharacterized protein LOC130134512 isoform X2 [Syzygium oleosum]